MAISGRVGQGDERAQFLKHDFLSFQDLIVATVEQVASDYEQEVQSSNKVQ